MGKSLCCDSAKMSRVSLKFTSNKNSLMKKGLGYVYICSQCIFGSDYSDKS